MAAIRIDQHIINISPGMTILDAARQAGIDIPTLCYRGGCLPLTTCFVCVVKVNNGHRLLPACATLAADGMVVESETDEVRGARRMALELLLSDHLGDCIGPCQSACPAHMDIPTMLRQIQAGQWREAITTVKAHIALPATLGRICPEICERACRRGQCEGAVAICLLKRAVADIDLASTSPYLPSCLPDSGKRVAIIGAGPAGLSAAYYLRQCGHACTLFDAQPLPGGMLRYGVPEARLPRTVLDAEITLVRALGAEIRSGVAIGTELTPVDLLREYHAVLIAVGEVNSATNFGLPLAGKGLAVDKDSSMTGVAGIFACGSSVTPSRHAIRALAGGRRAALAINAYLTGHAARSDHHYSVHIGHLEPAEIACLLGDAPILPRQAPTDTGFTAEQAQTAASRCLHCDCRKLDDCLLRQHAAAYGAKTNAYRSERRQFSWEITHSDIIYEPGKCIACGQCVQIAEAAREQFGLTFIGRGFTVRVGVPLNEAIAAGLRETALACATACPTAALAKR